MLRIVWPALTLLIAAGPLAASEFQQAYHSCKQDFHRNNWWPEPFIWPDRASVCAPFAVMVHNGWRLQNTLAAHHFREGTAELTEAGKLKVMWIVTEAPASYRSIYVERADNPAVTSTRIQNVQTLAAGMAMEGVSPPVFETGIPARGWPADRIDAITRRAMDTMPDPRLPDRSGGGSSGGN
jgi:hypothetical protein